MTSEETLKHFAYFHARVDSIRRSESGGFEVRAYIPSQEGGKMGSVFFEVSNASLAPKINQQLLVTISPTTTEAVWKSIKENP
ncbi:hypothetical protein LCGC14_2676050, partial [marine sediment metagenome]